MESPGRKNDLLTPSQRKAVEARGNVLVMAGAGTGKTHTLVERCLDCLVTERASLDEILVVTFTEAAATEMRQRLRRALEKQLQAGPRHSQLSTLNPFDSHCAEQLALFDAAHIGTLHSFCLKLVREHFYELGLDPQLAVLDAGEARLRAGETLDEELQAHYAGQDAPSDAVQKLIHIYGGGRDEKIRALVLRLHHYAQTRPDAEGWLAEQIKKFAAPKPDEWLTWLLDGIARWRDEWLPVLETLGTPGTAPARSSPGASPANKKAAEIFNVFKRLADEFTRDLAAEVLEQIVAADGNWPAKRKTVLRKPLEKLFDEAAFLASLATIKDGRDPLAEDWSWVRNHMGTLLQLAQNFSICFAERKRADGVLDFHDLEQFALKLLWDFAANQPTTTAARWRKKLRFVFVDEYQDINAAQDKIIQALSRDDADANRFLVGDVKQSIYRFRLADPKIFRDYARDWRGANGRTIPLTDNFRSRESLIHFVNSVFTPLMREEVGGVAYDAEAQLKFGSPDTRADFSVARDASPRAECLLRFKTGRSEPGETDDEPGADELADLSETEKEARLLVRRLKQLQAEQHLVWDDEGKVFRAVEWRDMAVLLRALSGKSEVYAMEFERAGVPLVIARGGFYESSEISDLLSLLQVLDNPLQDVPCIAVLRSPLVGLSLDELAQIRLAASGHFWFALNQVQNSKSEMSDEPQAKIATFLERFARWRKLARQASLSRCLEAVLTETHCADWLRSRPRGAQRYANVGRFLNLAQKFDQFQRQGLYRFLKFIEAQREAEVEPDVAAVADENAVRLMSIHQSKGLEFPVVAVADLAKTFNTQDLRGEIIFDEEFGLCPKVQLPQTGRRYPSLPHWLAQQHQRREQAGEELRLLYVALTRARDTLILTGSVTEKKWSEQWQQSGGITTQKIVAAKSYADWLGLWFAQQPGASSAMQGTLPDLRWQIVDDAELEAEKAEGGRRKVEGEFPEFDHKAGLRLQNVLTWQYRFSAATKRAAKSSVTALRREAEDLDDEAEPVFPARPNFTENNPKSEIRNPKLTAADTGTAHHKFLQRFSLADVGLTALEAEAGRLERIGTLSADERAALDLKAIAKFWNSDAGQKIRQHPANMKRELEFTARFSPAELGGITGKKADASLADEFIVVQGVADLVVLLPAEIWLVDFKTDAVSTGDLPGKIRLYEPQLKLYAGALGKIYSRPVTNCWLHFLSVNHTVNL
jgi:ATP-dependent helicase/nuclease subunit A